MKYFFTLGIIAALASGGFAQSNVVKIKPLRIGATAASGLSPTHLDLAYERKIIPALSVQINGKLGLEKDVRFPDIVNQQLDLDVGDASLFDAIGIGTPTVRSFAIHPEVRWYPTGGAPKGFFLAGYFKYNRLTVASAFSPEVPVEMSAYGQDLSFEFPLSLELEGQVNRTAFGLAIGNQWLVANDHLSIEVVWFGLGIGGRNVNLNASGDLISEADLRDAIEDEIGQSYNEDLPEGVITWESLKNEYGNEVDEAFEGYDWIPFYQAPSITSNRKSLTISMTSPAVHLRVLNFSVGFAF